MRSRAHISKLCIPVLRLPRELELKLPRAVVRRVRLQVPLLYDDLLAPLIRRP